MIWSRSSLCENTRSIQNRIISPFKKAQICLTQLLHNIWNLMIFYCIICEYAALSYFDYCCLTWPHTSLVLRIELIDGIGGPLINHSLISPPSRENGSPHEGPPPNTIISITLPDVYQLTAPLCTSGVFSSLGHSRSFYSLERGL